VNQRGHVEDMSLASSYGLVDMLEVLVHEALVDVNVKVYEATPLSQAAVNGQTET